MGDFSEFPLFIGRFHPLLAHLPIGLMLLLAALEALGRKSRFAHARQASGFILLLATPASMLAALCGWLLSRAGGYDPGLLRWHLWSGIGTAATCALAGWLYWRGLGKAYRAVLFSGCALLLAASHFGGSLTHGRGYLTRYAPLRSRSSPLAAGDSAEASFLALAAPILERHCVACHGPDKAKGGLRLDTLGQLARGGDNGPVFFPGNPRESDLVRRMRLPLDDDDHMPPEGKSQPFERELTALEQWIASIRAPAIIPAPPETNSAPAEMSPPAR